MVQSFDSLGVAERRHRMIPAGAGTERIRLEPAIGRTVSAVVAGSSDEESDLTRLGIPRRSIRVVPVRGRHRRVHPRRPRLRAQRPAPPGDRRRPRDRAGRARHAAARDVQGPRRRARRGRRPAPRRAAQRPVLPPAGQARPTPSTWRGRVFFAGQVGRSRPAAAAALGRPARQHQRVRAVGDHVHPGDGVRHPGHRLRRRRARSTPWSTAPPASSSRPAARPCSRRGSAQLLAHPMLLEAFSVAATDRARSRLLLGPDRARDPRRLRHRPRRVVAIAGAE